LSNIFGIYKIFKWRGSRDFAQRYRKTFSLKLPTFAANVAAPGGEIGNL
jgi:hypothetical protein